MQLKLLALSGRNSSGATSGDPLPALWLRKVLSRGGVRRSGDGAAGARTLSFYTAQVPLPLPLPPSPFLPVVFQCSPSALSSAPPG